jgi:hypothetical protein
MRTHLALKAAALASSLLLAGWYLHFRATGNSWLYTRAAEGAGDLAAASPTASAPATKPATILPSSKSGLVFQSRPVQFSDDQPVFAGQPATRPAPTDIVRLRNAIPMTPQDVMMSSSKSIVIFDTRDTAAQAAKAPIPSAPPDTSPPAPDRSTLLSSSKSGVVFTPPAGKTPPTPTTQPPASAPAPAQRKGATK